MSNCLFEATLQRIEEECKCTPVSKINSTFLYLLLLCFPYEKVKFMDFSSAGVACDGEGKKCMTDLQNSMGSVRMIGKDFKLTVAREEE